MLYPSKLAGPGAAAGTLPHILLFVPGHPSQDLSDLFPVTYRLLEAVR